MTAVGTGYKIDAVNAYYQHFYRELDKRFAAEGRNNPNPFTDLWEFHEYWKKHDLSTYSSRRAYVAGLYKDRPAGEGPNAASFWDLIHPEITAVARSRYESGHYADSVEAALKEINSRMKAVVKQQTGQEFDGADLMNRAFSPKNPILTLDDLSTEDGKNIQQGYMQIFAGAMMGARNPKAHSNIVLSPEEATDHLFLVSLMLKKFEAAAKKLEQEPETLKEVKRMYIRLIDSNNPPTLIKIRKLLDRNPGTTPAVLILGAGAARQIIKLPMQVKVTEKLTKDMEAIVGEKSVKVQ